MTKSPAVSRASDRVALTDLRQIPNVGPAVAADLRLLDISRPRDLVGRDPYKMYDDLCRVTRTRHDPCLLDTFMAAVRFIGGEPAKPWWSYTAERKDHLATRGLRSQKKARGQGL